MKSKFFWMAAFLLSSLVYAQTDTAYIAEHAVNAYGSTFDQTPAKNGEYKAYSKPIGELALQESLLPLNV